MRMREMRTASDYGEIVRTTERPGDPPQLCHRCEQSIEGGYAVATYRRDRRVPLCRSCGERRGAR